MPTDAEQQIGRNTGLLVEPPAQTDYVAGENSPLGYESRLPSGDWTQYLPTDEAQRNRLFDTMACVSFSALNCVEAQVNKLLADGVVDASAVAEFLDENGRFNASDRFTAKMSGTTRSGNYLRKVADSLRHHGVVPEKHWPYDRAVFDWNDYYASIPDWVKAEGAKFLELFDIGYEWVYGRADSLERHLRHAPIQIGTATCPGWSTEPVVPACGRIANHATMLYDIDASKRYRDFDQYKPYRKQLAADYPIHFAMKIVVTPRHAPNDESMRYVIDDNRHQWLIAEKPFRLAVTIANEDELARFRAAGLSGDPEPIANVDGYETLHGASREAIRAFYNLS